MLKQIFAFLIFMVVTTQSFASGISATNGVAQPSTCDTDTLETSTGPAKLRAEFTPEVINLRWYNDDTRINVPTTSNSCTYDTAISLPTNPTKPGYKFAGWDIIPGIPVQYIENNGTDTQYFDTGVPGNNNNYRIIIDFMILNLPQNRTWHTLIANYVDEQNNLWRVLYSKYGDLYLYTNTRAAGGRTCRPYPSNYIQNILNRRHLINFSYNDFSIDGETCILSRGPDGQNNNTTIKIFPDYGANNMTARIYSFKMYDGGALIRDMIPIKDYNNVPCMYDQVSKQIFYNAGTGNFIAGPEI